MKKALVPGTFDPITNGHLDIIGRASALVDEVILAVAASKKKQPLFTLEERVELAQEACAPFSNVNVLPFEGLLVDFAKECGTSIVIKGLRAITDFEYEFQMAALNDHLSKGFETIFIMSSPEYMFLSSSIVRELASLKTPADDFVPACVSQALRNKY